MIKHDKDKYGKAESSFLTGVFVLSLSTVIVKIIGLACKIPMLAVLGAEGMGYFNSAYEIYALLCVVSTAGLPVALSMIVSAARERNDGKGVKTAWRAAFAVFFLLGALGMLVLLFFAEPISGGIGNTDAASAIVAIAPSLLFVCISSAVRGYFQGFEYMTPTAVSQLIEAVGKLFFGVFFAKLAIDRGANLPIAAAYSVLGLTLGTALSAGYLLVIKLRDRRVLALDIPNDAANRTGTVKTLLRIAFPITVSSAVLSITRMIDMSLILHRLADIGVSSSQVNEIYGAYTTLALPVFSLVPSLITPIALSLVPQLSAAIEKKSRKDEARVLSDSMRLTVFFAMPASMGIALYARPILSILFAGQYVAIDISAPLLSVLGVSVLFSCVITTTNAILQSYRKTVLPIISMLVGSVIKIISAYFLIGDPKIGVMGAPISTFLCNLCITCMNLYFIFGVIKETQEIFKAIFRTLVASVGGIALSFAAYLPMRMLTKSDAIAFLVAVVVACLAYTAFAILTKVITVNDISAFSFRKIAKNKNIQE